MKKDKIIYFLLVTAVFNAVLRTSPDSTITLFRLLLPLSFIIIYSVSHNAFGVLIKSSIVLCLIASIQNVLTMYCFFPAVHTVSFSHLLNYIIHYISLFVIAALIFCLWKINKDDFFVRMMNFSSYLIKFILLIYIPYIIMGNDPDNFLVFGNINDLGCILTGGILVILFDTVTRKPFKIFYVLLLMALLLYNDSKLALFGGVLEVGLYYIQKLSVKFSSAKKIIFAVLIIIGIIGIYSFFNSSIELNGYSIHDLAYVPYYQITSGVYFDQSAQSFTFRTNNIIGITQIIKESYGLGVGPGNTSLILKYLIPDATGAIRQDYVSSHIWWYEIMADLGWIIIIPMLLFYIRQWKGFSSMKSEGGLLFSQIYIITFPIWCMSSSGLYTEFFSIMMIALSVIIYRKNRSKNNRIYNI